MKQLLKSNWTKWKPMQSYIHELNSYIVFSRLNTKTGMCQFKTKKIGNWCQMRLDFDFNVKFKELLTNE